MNAASTSVDVVRGQVEVADFRSGQTAQVMAGQHAKAFAHGNPGLSLGGSGTLSPIEQGQPRDRLSNEFRFQTRITAPRRASMDSRPPASTAIAQRSPPRRIGGSQRKRPGMA